MNIQLRPAVFANNGDLPASRPLVFKGPQELSAANSYQPPNALGVLQSALFNSLQHDDHSITSSGTSATTTAPDFSPQSVAERILGFIDRRIEQARAGGADAQQLSTLLQQARSGVEQGFAEARDVLDQLGVLNGDIAANVDDTYQRIDEGLDQREHPQNPKESAAISASALAYSEADAMTLTLQTRDGDTIQLQYAGATAYAQAEQLQQGADGTQWVESSSYSSSAQWQYSVNGELDADEQKALDQLLHSVDKVADQFFAGHTRSAFAEALHLDYNEQEFSGLQLDLSRSTSLAWQQQYQGVAALTDELSAPTAPSPDPVESVQASPTTRDWMQQLRSLLEQIRQSGLFADSSQAADKLLKTRLQQDPRFDAAKHGDGKEALLEGLRQLTSSLAKVDSAPQTTSAA